MQALESLNKKDMTEIKSYGRPPILVEKVMEAVMILRGVEPTWAEAKRNLGKTLLLPPGGVHRNYTHPVFIVCGIVEVDFACRVLCGGFKLS